MFQVITPRIRAFSFGSFCCDQAPMILPTVLNPFAEEAAPAVMTHTMLNWMIEGTSIEPILDAVSEAQNTREFLLSHFVQIIRDVACGFRRSPREVFRKRKLDLLASMSAFYRKLGWMESGVSAAIVRETASRARDLTSATNGLLPEPVPGYTARILDSNILTGTDHRTSELCSTLSVALPDMSQADYEPVSSGSWIATSAFGPSCSRS